MGLQRMSNVSVQPMQKGLTDPDISTLQETPSLCVLSLTGYKSFPPSYFPSLSTIPIFNFPLVQSVHPAIFVTETENVFSVEGGPFPFADNQVWPTPTSLASHKVDHKTIPSALLPKNYIYYIRPSFLAFSNKSEKN